VVPTDAPRPGSQINVIPNTAEAQVDVRRMPSETREELMARFRQTINDSSIEVTWAPASKCLRPSRVGMATPLTKRWNT
jgi:acetylornithine deacetylase/succinyl-diaminopimelate desuccinylase-like protein